jgi:pyruvate/2-oxoglutarate dehydrogenase complex dihydrolipoamide acyltransferase (E2) component
MLAPALTATEVRIPRLTACDHRIWYGADDAQLLAGIRSLLEEPLWLAM